MRYLLFFIAILSSYTPYIEAAIPETEKKALLAIAEFIDDGFLTQEWLKNKAQPCQWKGVSCDAKQQHVIKLNFTYFVVLKLSPQIANLPALEELNLSTNFLTTLPAEIGQLKALTRLDVSRNRLTVLPAEIGQLKSLKSLNVSYNVLTELPPEIGQLKHLEQLYANSNQIITIPNSIKALTHLNNFQLKMNWRKATFHANKVSPETRKIVKKIESAGYIDGVITDFTHAESTLYKTFIKFKKTASQEELLELVNYSSPAVRGYAFWALTEHPNIDLLPIIKQHFNDNETVNINFHYLRRTMRVGDFFIKVASSDAGRIPPFSAKKLSPSQWQTLEKMLIQRPNDFYTQNEALSRIKPDPALYARIRHLLIDEHNPAALVALAKYQKEQDIPLIINSFTYTERYYRQGARGYFSEGYNTPYIAIQSFPHPAFFPYLKNLIINENNQPYSHQSESLEALYITIAHYQNQNAVHLLTMPLAKEVTKQDQEEQFQARFCAAKQVNMDFYEPLLWSFWEKQYFLDSDVFSFLLNKAPERAFNLTIQSLKNIEQFYHINSMVWLSQKCNTNWNNRIPLINTLLNLAFKKQPKWTIDLIAEFIKSGSDRYGDITSLMQKKASEIKDPLFIPLLFEQFDKRHSDYVYVPLIRALLAFENEKITARLKKTILTHKNLWYIKKFPEFSVLFE